MNKKSDKPKNRINAVKNNFFALKLLWSICPKLVVHKAIRVILDYAGWLFYSAFFMRYVINALEQGRTFSSLMIFNLALFGYYRLEKARCKQAV